MKKILTALLGIIIGVSILVVFAPTPEPQLNTGAFNPAGGLTYRLQTSAGSADTSINLSSFKNRSSIGLTMTLLDTDIGYGTLSPQSSRSEFVSFTGITQNANGTAQLTGVIRGLSDIAPFTASTTLRERHPGQSIFILSDSPQLFDEFAKQRSDEAISGLWNFNTVLPTSNIQATTGPQFVTKALLDATTVQGVATSTELNGGIVELATQIEQASSTDGGATTPRGLYSKYSTSTPSGTLFSGLFAVISENDGKLSQLWTDLTEAFTWTGAHIFNTATTTFNSGVDIEADAVAPVIFNGVEWEYPSADGASSTPFKTDGNGKIVLQPDDWRLLAATTTEGAFSTATTTFTAPDHIRVYFDLVSMSSADNFTVRFNGDSGSNYGFKTINDIVVETETAGGNNIVVGATATTSPALLIMDIQNTAGARKILRWTMTYTASGALVPILYTGGGVWNNTSDLITTISFGQSSANIGAGSIIKVYGKGY